MNTAYKTLLAGMLAIVFSGPALAHHSLQSDGGWTGGASVVLQPDGQVYVGGSIGYAVNAVYASHQPVYYAPAPYHGAPHNIRPPACRHPSHYRPRGHHGHKHYKKQNRRHHH